MTLNSKLPVVHGTGGSPAYDDRVRRSIFASLKIGCTRTAAYLSAGVSEATFYRWLKESESFRQEVEKCEGIAERSHTMTLRIAARHGDVAASKFWLERRRPANWRERTTLEVVPSLEDDIDEGLNDADVARRLQSLAGDALRRGTSGAGGSPDDGAGPPEGAGEPSGGERVPVPDGAT